MFLPTTFDSYALVRNLGTAIQPSPVIARARTMSPLRTAMCPILPAGSRAGNPTGIKHTPLRATTSAESRPMSSPPTNRRNLAFASPTDSLPLRLCFAVLHTYFHTLAANCAKPQPASRMCRVCVRKKGAFPLPARGLPCAAQNIFKRCSIMAYEF